MSASFKHDDDYSVDIEELLQIGSMCRKLREEKNMLRESLFCGQSKSTELIMKLQSDVKALSQAREADNKYIEELERELRNGSQEIGYLKHQLNLRNVEANCVAEHVHSLELKLAEVHKLHEKVSSLREERGKFHSERTTLMRELHHKEVDLQNSATQIEKLEALVSSIALESQCEVESLKLDLTVLEQRCSDAEKQNEQAAQEKASMGAWIEELEVGFQELQLTVTRLERENKELQARLVASEGNTKMFYEKIEEQLDGWLKNNKIPKSFKLGSPEQPCHIKLDAGSPVSGQICNWEEFLGPSLSKLAAAAAWDGNLKDEMEKLSLQFQQSERFVQQLKEELREEKSKAKEEAEDLTQEMAELRYQMTDMLEQESKRRACIEQASLQRIAELEALVRKEQRKSSIAIRHFLEAQKLAQASYSKVQHSKNALVGLQLSGSSSEISQEVDTCSCGDCLISRDLLYSFDKELLIAEAAADNYAGDSLNQAALEWHRGVTDQKDAKL